MNFFDPRLTSDGKPYGKERYKNIVMERFLISKHINTSYGDTENISPIERAYLLEFIQDDLKTQADIMKDIESKRNSK